MAFENKDEALGVLRSFVNDVVPARVEATARDIAAFAVEKATELSPFDTGRFMASWRITLTPEIDSGALPGQRSSEYEAATEAVSASQPVVSQIKFGQTFYLGNGAPYAVFVEYGGPTIAPHMITQRVAQSIGAVYGKISLGGSTRHRFTWAGFNEALGIESGEE